MFVANASKLPEEEEVEAKLSLILAMYSGSTIALTMSANYLNFIILHSRQSSLNENSRVIIMIRDYEKNVELRCVDIFQLFADFSFLQASFDSFALRQRGTSSTTLLCCVVST